MLERNPKFRTENYRTLLRGACWFASLIAFAVLLTACGGGGEDSTPPLTSAASIQGTIRIASNIPMVPLPGVSEGIFMRIVDPGDDIGGLPVPKPGTLSEDGTFIIPDLNTDPLAYLNLHFTIGENIENNGSEYSPVDFNIPVSLSKGIATLFTAQIDRPEFNVLSITYSYRGPDGNRDVRLTLNFATDLITYDFDSDSRFDDLIAVDADHDLIPDEQEPVVESIETGNPAETVGEVTGIGSNAISLSGNIFEIWGNTNIRNSITGDPVSLAEISNGSNLTINYLQNSGSNIALDIAVDPSPENPYGKFSILRDGVIEELGSDNVFVNGTLFTDYRDSDITDILGQDYNPDDLTLGSSISVTGVRSGETIAASEIIVNDISAETVYIDRQGTIESLIPEENPSEMTVAGMNFILLPQTVIEDLSGMIVDNSRLILGNPVRVYGIESDGLFYANLIELQYTIDDRLHNPEIVVLYDDANSLPFILNAIGQLDSTTPIAPVLVASYDQTDLPCIQDAFHNVALGSYAGNIMASLSGFRGAFPRVVDGSCEVLVLIKDTRPETAGILDIFFPYGIGTYGTPLVYDFAKREPFYGVSEDFVLAAEEKHALEDLIESDEHVLEVYISSDIDFTDG